MCHVLHVSRSGYYAYLKRDTHGMSTYYTLVAAIKKAHRESYARYGSPRIAHVLQNTMSGPSCRTIARIMRAWGIRSKIRRKYTPMTTVPAPNAVPSPNMIQQRFAITQLNTVWYSDITYIPTDQGWMYLAVVLDACSRNPIGWAMADTLQRDLVRALLESKNIVQSMSAAGYCYDNAVMESWFHSLKTEYVAHEHCATRAETAMGICYYIETFYKRIRLHSALNYRSPVAFEASLVG